VLEDRAGKDVTFLSDNLNKFLVAARKRPEIGMISSTFIPSVPEQYINVDQDKVLKQGVAISDVYQTIQAYMGGLFVNYFNDFGRTWQVYIEAEAPYRANTQDLSQFYVRNNQGQNVPLSALANFETDYGPEFTLATTSIAPLRSSQRCPGYSSQQATAASKMFSVKPCPTKWASTTWACLIRSRKHGRVCQPGYFRAFTSLRFSDSCRTLRKLDVALQRPAEHSCRRIRRPRNPVAASLCNRLYCRHTWSRWRTMFTPRLVW